MRRSHLVLAAVAVGLAVPALVAFVLRPEHAFLVASGDAEWIRAARPFELVSRSLAAETAAFRQRFSGPGPGSPPANASLRVQALRSFRLFVNGRAVGAGSAEESTWRTPRSFDLSPYLAPGTNELRVEVENDRGPPLLLVSGPALGIATGAGWDVQGEDGAWRPAVPARAGRRHPITSEFPSAWQGLRATRSWLLAAFGLGVGGSLAYSRWLASAAGGRVRLRPSHVRWLVLSALALVCLHNLTRVRIEAGFDAPFHFEYIRHLIAARRVPLANEGWQTFQPPLFYFVAAPPYFAVARLASEATAMLATRVLVLACGLALVEMVYRAARAAFPGREDLQTIATATGGFLPMTVYMSHYVSNEPFAAALTAALVVSAFRLLADPAPRLDRWGFGLGLLFGLALLAKVTVALLLPLLVAVLVRAALRRGSDLRSAVDGLVRFGLAGGAVAGWYFARNWILLGTPYLGGWDPSRGGPLVWIQDPGYRIPQDLLSFGVSLVHPIYAAFSGFWDGVYSTFWLDGFLGSAPLSVAAPPWRYDYVVACALLALPLGVAGVAGALRSLRVPRDATGEALLFASVAVGVYLAAMFALYVRLPVYSTVKSTYAMGLAPCYGVLFARGFDLLPRRAPLRALLAGYLTAWLAFVFRGYFS